MEVGPRDETRGTWSTCRQMMVWSYPPWHDPVLGLGTNRGGPFGILLHWWIYDKFDKSTVSSPRSHVGPETVVGVMQVHVMRRQDRSDVS
jgi:hypothetical protein